MEKSKLESLLSRKLSLGQMGEELGCSKSNINYHISKYELRDIFDSYKDFKKGKLKISLDEEEQISESVKNSNSLRECLVLLGRNDSSMSYKWLQRRLLMYNIDTSHFVKRKGRGKILQNTEIFTKDSKVSRASIKSRLIEEKLLPYECSSCGNTGIWQDKKLTLVLDHIDGVRDNNELSNLRFVCPNCNSQLETHCKGRKAPLAKLDTAPEYESGDFEGSNPSRSTLKLVEEDLEKVLKSMYPNQPVEKILWKEGPTLRLTMSK